MLFLHTIVIAVLFPISLSVSANAREVSAGISQEPEGLSCRVSAIKEDLLNDHTRGILVAAHRGHHGKLPENSVSSIFSAANVGADIVELDVLLSKDGIPILMHDETVDRTTTGTGNVDQLTLVQLKSLRLVARAGLVTEETIPTLREALTASRGRLFVNIDLKATDVGPIIRVVLSENMLDHVMFYHASLAVRDQILAVAPEAIVMPIARDLEQAERFTKNYGLKLLHLRESYNSLALSQLMDRQHVAGWTNALGVADEQVLRVGPDTAFAPLVANAPDVIQTDHPVALLRYLRDIGRHWTAHGGACP